MPEDNNQQANSGVSTQDPAVSTPNDNQVPVDRAELERLQKAEARIKKLDESLVDTEFSTIESYVEGLEVKEWEKSQADNEPSDDAPTETKSAAPVTSPTTGLSDADKKMLKETNQASVTAVIEAQKTAWEMRQGNLPEDQRCTAPVEELLKIMYGPKAQLIAASARAYGGNYFETAAALYDLEHGVASARKAGAAAEKAKAAAAATANLDPGGTTAEPAAKTPEEKRAELNKQEADKIAPDDPPFDMTE